MQNIELLHVGLKHFLFVAAILFRLRIREAFRAIRVKIAHINAVTARYRVSPPSAYAMVERDKTSEPVAEAST